MALWWYICLICRRPQVLPPASPVRRSGSRGYEGPLPEVLEGCCYSEQTKLTWKDWWSGSGGSGKLQAIIYICWLYIHVVKDFFFQVGGTWITYILISHLPVRPLPIGDHFPHHNPIAPDITGRGEFSEGDGFWSCPSDWDFPSLGWKTRFKLSTFFLRDPTHNTSGFERGRMEM